jgi:hypothetical protein
MRLPLLTVLLLAGPALAAPTHWSLRPIQRPPVPALRDGVRTPVDAFVLDRLTRQGLRPAPEADRVTLIRRITFDLTGLPPTLEEMERARNDESADWYERLVERLLASPAYGERWGRHWLDVVRYAETEGFEYDRQRPGAWRFRDYVIDSFNRDKPFDRFILEQLAGDEIGPKDPELQVAAGFQRLGPVRRNAGNPELALSREEVLTEMTDVVGSAFLGLTIGCARCHDHMFDEISQTDYYRMQAFFAATQENDIVLADAGKRAEWQATTQRIQSEVKKLQKTLSNLKGEELKRAEAKMRELDDSLPPPLPTISSVQNVETKRTPIHVLKRGNPEKKERQVGPRSLRLLPPGDVAELPADAPQPRTTLAKWIVEPSNPLTARVLVNRLWQYHFGRGLVETSNDFGINGARPTHPELLDWLATEFVRSGWSIKHMHRVMVLSATYRQSSERIARNAEQDPDNRLLWRFSRRRLGAEEVRDAMLAIAGRLNPKVGGPSVVVPVEPDLVQLLYAPKQWTVTPDVREHDRRSVYLIARRNLRLPFMEAFDQPDAQTSCGRREASTHALQSLELLNGNLANDLAEKFAQRLEREAGSDPVRKVEQAYLLIAGRPPTARERDLALAALKHLPLKEFALAMFNLNAFLYVS